jgi:hypothetical protein
MKTPILFLTLFLCSFWANSQTLYVDSTAALGGNGGSWATAFSELSDALDSAWQNPAIEAVYVAKGTYYPAHRPYEMNSSRVGVEFFGGPNENVTFHIRTGLEMLGGFPNGGGFRAPNLNETTLDGLLPNGDTVYRVCYIDSSDNWTSVNDTTIVNGFTIKHGSIRDFNNVAHVNGNGWSLVQSGGVFISSGSFLLEDNRVVENNSAISIDDAHGILRNNIISNNDSLFGGSAGCGGVNIYFSSLLMEQNMITNNSSRNVGAINCENYTKSLSIINNHIENNWGDNAGGGFLFFVDLIFQGNVIKGNKGIGIGGFGFSAGVVRENLFLNNSANIGAAQLTGHSIFANNVVVGNTGSQAGGIYTQFGDSLFVTNNTFVSNSNFAIRICCGASSFSNNIFSNNRKDFEWSSDVDTSQYIFRNNLLQDDSIQYNITNYKPLDSLDSDNIYNQNPLFVDINDPLGPDGIFGTADDGLHLAGNSPCIDAGNNALISIGITTDVTGAPRINNGTVNMGAYESIGWPVSNEVLNPIDEGIKIFPNPTAETLQVKTPTDGELYILDALGKTIHGMKLKKGLNKVDVSALSKGIYFLELKDDKLSKKVKFLKN